MTAVIVAAAPPGPDYPPGALPACLYHEGGEVRLDRRVAGLRTAGAERVRVVVGYGADRVRRHCALQRAKLGALEFIENTAWAGNAAAGPEMFGEYRASDEARLAPLIPAAWRRSQPTPVCRPDTPRCDFWNWGPEALRPRCCTAHLRDLLFFTDELLTRHGILHWLDYGPLLGVVRDGGLIPWDYDVDFGVLLEDRHRIAALGEEIVAAGFRLLMRDDHVWRINLSDKNHNHADMFPWHREGGQLCLSGPYAGTGEFPPEWLENLQPVRLFGRRFLAPAPVEEFLVRYRYGAQYMTPRRFPSEPTVAEAAVDRFLTRRFLRQLFENNLRTLHAALLGTGLGERHWFEGEPGGLEGTELAADFAFFRRDLPGFAGAAVALAAAGFEPRWRYRNNAGEGAQFIFVKDGAAFNFFVLEARADQHSTCWRFEGGRQIESEWRRPGATGDPGPVTATPWTYSDDDRFLLDELPRQVSA